MARFLCGGVNCCAVGGGKEEKKAEILVSPVRRGGVLLWLGCCVLVHDTRLSTRTCSGVLTCCRDQNCWWGELVGERKWGGGTAKKRRGGGGGTAAWAWKVNRGRGRVCVGKKRNQYKFRGKRKGKRRCLYSSQKVQARRVVV